MLLSDFGRIGFDPFLEMRRMQQEMNQRLGGLTADASSRQSIFGWARIAWR
jgi:HSP20 family protein